MYEYVCVNVSSTIYVDLSCSVRESVVSHSVVSHSSRLHVSSPPGSSVHGILQARMLEWVAMLSSRGSSQPRDQTQVSHIPGMMGLSTAHVTKLPSM